jgi:hypothetical protein
MQRTLHKSDYCSRVVILAKRRCFGLTFDYLTPCCEGSLPFDVTGVSSGVAFGFADALIGSIVGSSDVGNSERLLLSPKPVSQSPQFATV